ncbi:MAG TPA: hypothetical protein VGN72_00310 [Tepidisphaeraceae bacterium]|jgi:hypothetical protein|nr:hypothetical protein [Tepidisphaeraceae bacterium]
MNLLEDDETLRVMLQELSDRCGKMVTFLPTKGVVGVPGAEYLMAMAVSAFADGQPLPIAIEGKQDGHPDIVVCVRDDDPDFDGVVIVLATQQEILDILNDKKMPLGGNNRLTVPPPTG